MPRVARHAPGGMVFHVLNRGVGRMQLFRKPGDYEAFERREKGSERFYKIVLTPFFVSI